MSAKKGTEKTGIVKHEPPPVVAVMVWLVEGKRAHDVERLIRENYPNENPNDLLLEALNNFKATAATSTDAVVGWALESFREVYQRALAVGDFQSAIKALERCVKLKREYVFDDDNHEP